MVQLSEERQAQLAEYAERHGQDPAAALDAIVADALKCEQQDYQQAVEGIRRGYADLKAGRTRPLSESIAELRGNRRRGPDSYLASSRAAGAGQSSTDGKLSRCFSRS